MTAGDLTFTVKPYDDKDQLFDQALAAEASVAVAASGADVVGQFAYALRGVKRVRVSVKNNNAAGKLATVSFLGTLLAV